MSIRTFIAVEIDEAVRSEVELLLLELEETGADVKWVAPENIHVTVKFLGGVDETDVPRVCRIMDEAAAGIEPFDLAIVGAGGFPNAHRPRVIWVGVKEDGDRLAELYRRLDEALTDVGIAPEGRAYVPHLTIGRARTPRGIDRIAPVLARAADRRFGEFTVEDLTLFESTLARAGPTYTPLYRAGLGR